MTYLDDILGGINKQRAALDTSGGVEAPPTPWRDNVLSPVPVASGSSQQEATHSLSDEDKLAKALKSLRQNGAGPAGGIDGLKKFGGQVLGYGQHTVGEQGHAGSFAVVKRDGKLFHLYDDGTKMKIDVGKVARALGIHERQGALEVVRGAHGAGNGTGGVEAPAGDAGAGSSLPGLDALTGGAQAPTAGAGLDARTGGAVAPRDLQRLAMLLRLHA